MNKRQNTANTAEKLFTQNSDSECEIDTSDDDNRIYRIMNSYDLKSRLNQLKSTQNRKSRRSQSNAFKNKFRLLETATASVQEVLIPTIGADIVTEYPGDTTFGQIRVGVANGSKKKKKKRKKITSGEKEYDYCDYYGELPPETYSKNPCNLSYNPIKDEYEITSEI